MYCGACIQSTKEKADVCPDPECKLTPWEVVNLSRYERIKLNETEFNCYKCPESFIYEDRAKHLANCRSLQGLCPAKCGEIGIKTENDLELHIEFCPNIVRWCQCHDIPECIYVL